MKTAKEIKEAYKLKYAPAIFSTERAAISSAKRCLKAHLVVLGDDCKFWVVCFADAQRLTKAGYEVI